MFFIGTRLICPLQYFYGPFHPHKRQLKVGPAVDRARGLCREQGWLYLHMLTSNINQIYFRFLDFESEQIKRQSFI